MPAEFPRGARRVRASRGGRARRGVAALLGVRPRGGVPALLGGLAVAALCAACGSSGALSADAARTPSHDPLIVVTTSTVTSTSAVTTTPTVALQRTPAGLRATVSAGGEAAVKPTPSRTGFLGIATPMATITGLSGTPSAPDTAFTQLLKNLSPGVPLLLRLGGDSADRSWWKVPGMAKPRAITYTMTPQWGADVAALLTALGPRAQTMVGVNLELDSRRVARYEVRQFAKYLGSRRIYGFELGNEPELYAAYYFYRRADGQGVFGRRPGDYSLRQYTADFDTVAAALGPIPLVGPASQGPVWLADLNQMLRQLPHRLKLVTVHDYALKHCSPTAHLTEAELLADSSIGGLADTIRPMVAAAHAHGKDLRLDEFNGVTCGGQTGLSNSFGEALWALNVLPALWRAGVAGVNFQTNDDNANALISATSGAGGWSTSVEPEYYGILTFADAAPAGSHLMTISTPSAGFYQFAVRSPDGNEHVVVTNTTAESRTLGVSARGAHGTGTVSLLSARALTADSGTTLAGQTVSAASGQLDGQAHYTAVTPNARGVYALSVPADSAAILTVGS